MGCHSTSIVVCRGNHDMRISSSQLIESIKANDKFGCLSVQSEFKHKVVMTSCIKLNESEYAIGCSDGSIHFRDILTHKLIPDKNLPKVHKIWIWSIILVEDKLITGSGDGTIEVWGINNMTKNSICTLNHGSDVFALVHVRDQIIASGGSCGVIKLWDIKYFSCLYLLKNHSANVWGLLMYDSHHQVILSVSQDKSIRLWSVQPDFLKGKESRCILTKNQNTASLQLNNKVVAVGTRCGHVDIWNIESCQLLNSLIGHSGWIWSIVRLSENFIGTCSEDKTIRIWELQLMAQRKVLNHSDSVNSLIRLNNYMLASLSDDYTLKVWSSKA